MRFGMTVLRLDDGADVDDVLNDLLRSKLWRLRSNNVFGMAVFFSAVEEVIPLSDEFVRRFFVRFGVLHSG